MEQGSRALVMKLELPRENTETDDENHGGDEEIRVTVHLQDKPPIIIRKDELTRWSEEFNDYDGLQDDELLLLDGFEPFDGNWEEVNDCIALLQGKLKILIW